jgi:hypothetical protein
MTIPSTYKRNTTGGAFTTQKIGGVIIGITSATDTTDGQPVTEVFDLKSQGDHANSTVVRRTTPKDTAATIEAKGSGSGTFAYDQVAFMLRGSQSSNTINGSASTELTINGNGDDRDREKSSLAAIGAKTGTAWRAGNWRPLGVSAQRTNWSSGPDAVFTHADSGYYQGDSAAYTSSDDAVGTQAVPGELAYMYGALDAKQDDYKERTGA